MNLKKQSGYIDFKSLFMLFVLLLIVLFGLFGGKFANQEIAERALEKQGFSNIQIISHQWAFVKWHGCSYNDVAKFKAKATNTAGKKVEVSVCTGWRLRNWLFGGPTIIINE